MFNIFKSKPKKEVNTLEKVNELLHETKNFKPSVIHLGEYYWNGLPKTLKYSFHPNNIIQKGIVSVIPMKTETFYRNILLKLDKNDMYRFDLE